MYLIPSSRVRLLALACLTIAGITIGSIASADCVDPNTCFGTGALQQHISGDNNSAFGFQALGTDEIGQNNTAIGAHALHPTEETFDLLDSGVQTIDGNANTAVGSYALKQNTTGRSNTAVGTGSLQRNSIGTSNVGIGEFALEFTNTGDSNVAVGRKALWHNKGGGHNTALGEFANAVNDIGFGNVAVGASAMSNYYILVDSPPQGRSSYNVAVGYGALFFSPVDSENTAVGARSLQGNELYVNTGAGNTAIGVGAMESIESGSFNTASGHLALFSIRTGQRNTAIGKDALFSNTRGNYNTANGNNSLRNMTTGYRNVALGHRAGYAVTTGSDNIIIGADNQGTAADAGVIRIGRSANQKKAFIAGIRGVKTGATAATTVFIDANGQLGTVKSSREVKEDILPMGDVSDRLLELRPVTFRYKEADDDGSKPIQFGLIAEEVAETFPELVVYDEYGEPETVSYHLLATLLLNEFQKEHSITHAQALRIADLEKQSDELERFKQVLSRMTEIVDRLNQASMIASAR